VAFLAALAAATILPGFTPVASGPHGGTVLQGVLPGTERPGLVYLPPGFPNAGHDRTVYLLHGMPGSPSEFIDGAGFLQWADDAIAAGRVRSFVAVMPAAGSRDRYDGEWAGPWERALVERVVPWIDAHLPVSPANRVLAGLSAGGFGAADIALRNPGVFGVVESWGGYFKPLRDGPFKHATRALLSANDPRALVRTTVTALRANGTRFFLSTGPFHSHWFRPSQTVDFAGELRSLGLPVRFMRVAQAKGEWTEQLAAGLGWALTS
jgi:enterochelin esterase-like enzyme